MAGGSAGGPGGDPVAEAAEQLAGYLARLEGLLAEPAAEEGPGVASRPAEPPEPWFGPAGRVYMDIWEGVKRLEAVLLYLGPAGHPGRARGGSAGNVAEAFTALPKLAAGVDAEVAGRAARWLEARITEARRVHGIDEGRRLRHLPRRPGEALPPRCPYCGCFQLVADLDAKTVACTVYGCADGEGNPPVATMGTGADGRAQLCWPDRTETAPDLDSEQAS